MALSAIQIYLSYAHADDSAPPDVAGAVGFVTTFQRQLEYALRDRGPAGIRIWKDNPLNSSPLPQHEEAIRNSDALLVVLSPNWLASDYARQELDSFAGRRQRSEDIEALERRIIVVGRLPVDRDSLPPLLRQPAYNFFEMDELARPRAFFACGVIQDDRYFEQIEEIGRRLERLSRELLAAPIVDRSRHTHDPLIDALMAKRNAAFIEAPMPALEQAFHPAPDGPLLFINAADEDKDFALKVKDLVPRPLACVTPVAFDGKATPQDRLSDLTAKFVECDALVTAWGTAPETWVRATFRQYQKLSLQRKEKLKANILVPSELRLRHTDDLRLTQDVRVVRLDEVSASLKEMLLLSDMSPRSLGAAATPIEEARGKEVVELSAFAPQSVRPSDQILVQVFLHCPADRVTAKALALEADPDTAARGVATLSTELARDQTLGISLQAPGLSVEESMQYVTWRGEPRACQFLVSVPPDAAGRVFQLQVRAVLHSVPIGVLRFTLRAVTASERVNREERIRGDFAKRFRYAFLSYASPDRPEVIKRAMMLKAVGIEFFMDLLHLDPGERWERKLYQQIDLCDVFFLFWSSNAAQSSWVEREARYALDRHDASKDEEPDIRPIIIEGPPVPPRPESLREIHFNDPLCYVLAGVEAERRSRA
jgi:hypothetical protein